MATVGALALVSLEEARDYLKEITTDEDPRIAALVDGVSAAIDIRCKRKLLSRTYDGSANPKMLLDGRGFAEIAFREYPVTAVTSIVERYSDGVTTRAMDLTGSRLLYGGRRLWVPRDVFAIGRQNIEVVCTAGYTAALHPNERTVLKLAALRWLQVMWQDRAQVIGRGQTFGVGDQSVSLLPDALPKDIADALRSFERISL